MSVLGDNLKKRRVELDITQEEMAAKINKAATTYCRYEAGTLRPDIDTLLMIADILQVSIDELTGRDLKIIMQAFFRHGMQTGEAVGEGVKRKRATKRKKKAEE